MNLIIFDIDGTLTDTNAADTDCFIRAFKDVHDIELSKTNWNKYNNVTSQGITQEIFLEYHNRMPGQEEIDGVHQRFTEHLNSTLKATPAQFRPVPGAVELIDIINKSDEFLCAIGTGGWSGPSFLKLDHIGIDHQKIPFGCSDKLPTKTEILQDLINKAASDYERAEFDTVTYVGDRIYDLEAATDLGLSFIGVDIDNNCKLNEAGAKKIFDSLSNHADFLNHITSH